ncbi:PEP-CTERM sorting domain-containing protein [Nitrosomonas sp.]|uniref:PEP-CTERM sorting domain-containing protein n=1 Tax=Nitrosomonas sp. TaxID=42353 RepID=UPI001DDC84E2|nr:PEP-CTERM sorting domain-containing protein [Nitrosomonas sp.]MBX3618069.1 PEP-CTERM sorting domain-containing protein [Nitrosomonas sp.]
MNLTIKRHTSTLAASLRCGIIGAAAMLAVNSAQALDFQLVSHIGDNYSYTLTYGPDDNMWYVENGNVHATIQLSGLFGVTSVFGPLDNDFPSGPIHDGQLNWTGSVLFGGAVVRFTMLDEDVGTGNFSTEKHVLGFTLVAPGTSPIDKISLDTNGFYNGHTLDDRDVHTFISGPGIPAIPEPSTYLMLMAGLFGIGTWMRQRQG